jgi:hypothetical protein
MILRHLHIQRLTTIPKILARQHRTLLANQQRRAVRVAPNIVRANRQVRDLEALDAVHVEALVEHAVLDNRVAFARGHAARAEGVPCGFDVACGVLVYLDGRGRGGGKVRFVQSMTCSMSLVEYSKSGKTSWLFELRKLGSGARPFSTGMVQLPCWIPAVMLPGKAYALVVARSMSFARAGLSYE